MSRIFQRKGIWYVDFEYKSKRHRKSLGTRSKQVAQLALKDIDVKVAREKFDLAPPKKIRFEEFSVKFLEWYQVQNSKKSYQDYRNLFTSTIMPAFSNVTLTDVTPEKIENYKIQRSKTISPSSVNKELIALTHLFNKAILWGYLSQNPAKDVDKLRVQERKFRFLTLEEVTLVLNASPGYIKSILMTAIHTGLRKSELFRLEWGDINFEGRYLVVDNKAGAHTKNYQIREIPLTPQLYEVLKSLRQTTSHKNGHVFLKLNGEPHRGELRKTLATIIRKTGIPAFSFHDLRHTFASHLVMVGVDLPTVQKLMGHSDIKTTMLYAHLAPDHLRGAIDRLGKRLNA